MPRNSLRRKSTSSLLFKSSSRPNQNQSSKKASSYEEQRAEIKEKIRENEMQKERRDSLIALYDQAAVKSIDIKKWLDSNECIQRLKLLQEIRSVKFMLVKIRRDQLKHQKQDEEEAVEVCLLMKRHMTTYISDIFFGAKHVDARQTMSVFPMEVWTIMRNALHNDYFKQANPIAKKWARDVNQAEAELKLIIKKIKMALFKTYDSILAGTAENHGLVKIAETLAKTMYKEIITEDNDDINDLVIMTRFQSRLLDQSKAELMLINISSKYGTQDCSSGVNCLGDTLENYMLFKNCGSWKLIVKQMLTKIRAFFVTQNRFCDQMNGNILPLTQIEKGCQGDSLTPIPDDIDCSSQRTQAREVREHPPIQFLSDDSIPSADESSNSRRFASERFQEQKTFSTKRVREEDTGLPTPKKQKIQDSEPLFSDSEPPCSPEPFLPELEVLTQ